MIIKKKISSRKKKLSKLVLVLDIKSGQNIFLPLSTINKSPDRFKLIQKK